MYQDNTNTLDSNRNIAVHGGFPNPALEHSGQGNKLALDLNKALINHPSSTFMFRVSSSDDTNAQHGIFNGDLALIDRSLQAHSGDLVLIWQASGFAICRYNQITPQDTFWGVISATIHERRKQL